MRLRAHLCQAKEKSDFHSTWALVPPVLRKGLAALPHPPPRPKHTALAWLSLQDHGEGARGAGHHWLAWMPHVHPAPGPALVCSTLCLRPPGSTPLPPPPTPSTPRQCRPPEEEATLTSQVPDEGHGLDGVAAVGEGLDDVVLHDTQHAEAALVTCGRGHAVTVGLWEFPGELTSWPPGWQRAEAPSPPKPCKAGGTGNPSLLRPSPRSVSCQARFRTCPLTCKSHHMVNGREHFGLPDRHPFTCSSAWEPLLCCSQETPGLSQLRGDPRPRLCGSAAPGDTYMEVGRVGCWPDGAPEAGPAPCWG